MQLSVFKVTGTHEAGFRITEPVMTLAFSRRSNRKNSQHCGPERFELRNAKVVQITSSLSEGVLRIALTDERDKEIFYSSAALNPDLPDQPFRAVMTLDDGLRYMFELEL